MTFCSRAIIIFLLFSWFFCKLLEIFLKVKYLSEFILISALAMSEFLFQFVLTIVSIFLCLLMHFFKHFLSQSSVGWKNMQLSLYLQKPTLWYLHTFSFFISESDILLGEQFCDIMLLWLSALQKNKVSAHGLVLLS